jgi:hypothetical protein
MLTKVCIEVRVVDYEFHDSYFISWIWKMIHTLFHEFERGYTVCETNSTMTIVIKLILV